MSKYMVDYPNYVFNLSYPEWAFDYLGVWARENGFYISTDSGCSCPTPWENHTEDDLTGPLTADQVMEEAAAMADGDASEDLEDLKTFLEQA